MRLQTQEVSDTGTATFSSSEILPSAITVQAITQSALDDELSDAEPYKKWHHAISELHDKHADMQYGKLSASVSSGSFQLINWLASHPQYAYDRDSLEAVAAKLGVHSRDVIQLVNKTDQRGLIGFSFKWNSKLWYCLPSIIYDGTRLKARAGISS